MISYMRNLLTVEGTIFLDFIGVIQLLQVPISLHFHSSMFTLGLVKITPTEQQLLVNIINFELCE